MEVTQLSFIDLIRNISLALFAISTWYVGREEKRVRTLLNASLTTVNRSVLSLVDIIIELRDEEGLDKSLDQQLGVKDLILLHKKINKLKMLDTLRILSVVVFTLSVFAEIGVFVSFWLMSILN